MYAITGIAVAIVAMILIASTLLVPGSGPDQDENETIRSSLLGSALLGTSEYEGFNAVVVDGDGYVFALGFTYGAGDLATEGAYDRTSQANADYQDVIIAKFSPDLNTLVACTFLGGSGWDMGHSIELDEDGNVYVIGGTTSRDFPTTSSAYRSSWDQANQGNDLFISVLSSDLSTLISSTYCGVHSYGYFADLDLMNDEVYIAGTVEGPGMNTTAEGFDTTFFGDTDAFVMVLSADLEDVIGATYLGGAELDGANAIKVGSNGDVFVVGQTWGENLGDIERFPTTPGAYDETVNYPIDDMLGAGDGFIVRLSSNLRVLKASTVLGGLENDQLLDLDIDPQGNVVVGGFSHGSFPVTEGAYIEVPQSHYTGVVAKLDGNLTQLMASTYVGMSGGGVGALQTDDNGSIYITGTCANFSTTEGAFDPTYNGGSDMYLALLDPKLESLISATYLGGARDEYDGYAMSLASGGLVFIAGSTTSSDFPTLDGNSGNITEDMADAFVVKISMG